MAAAELTGQPVERHSSFMGSLLKRCMAGAHPEGRSRTDLRPARIQLRGCLRTPQHGRYAIQT